MAEEPQPAKSKSGDSLYEQVTAPFDGDPWAGIDFGNTMIEELKRQGKYTPRPPLPKAARKLAEAIGIFPIPNLAVDFCIKNWREILKASMSKVENGKPKFSKTEVEEHGRLAYCDSLPRLSTRNDVNDFIACVVHGMALGIIPGTEGTRLLYGAQVACSAFPPRKKYQKRAKSTPQDAPKPPETSTGSAV